MTWRRFQTLLFGLSGESRLAYQLHDEDEKAQGRTGVTATGRNPTPTDNAPLLRGDAALQFFEQSFGRFAQKGANPGGE